MVASVSRIDKMIGLFCKRDLQKRQYSAKETNNLIDPTHHSHPIVHLVTVENLLRSSWGTYSPVTIPIWIIYIHVSVYTYTYQNRMYIRIYVYVYLYMCTCINIHIYNLQRFNIHMCMIRMYISIQYTLWHSRIYIYMYIAKFSKGSSLPILLCKMTMNLTFEICYINKMSASVAALVGTDSAVSDHICVCP